jgi:twitching motility protein PilT
MDIFAILNEAIARQTSDVLLSVSSRPMLRIHGSLEPAEDIPPLSPADIDEALSKLATAEQLQYFRQYLELDFAYTLPDHRRIRCNAGRQKGSTNLVIRLLPAVIPDLLEMALPAACRELILRPRGLVIVSGPTGSGKSTTLAAMIQYLNTTQKRHIVTIEDPIEYVYTNLKSVISQRELGSDTLSFAEALKRVLRQNPDVILVGEMRDPETAAAVLTLAETGHLVLTTGHAPSAPQAIERVTDLFPVAEQHLAQTRLASLLLGVLCQALVPKADKSGRVAAVEVMLADTPVRNLIREGKLFQLPNTIRTRAQMGMITMDQSLINLYRQKQISYESLLAFCNDQDEVEKVAGKGATLVGAGK